MQENENILDKAIQEASDVKEVLLKNHTEKMKEIFEPMFEKAINENNNGEEQEQKDIEELVDSDKESGEKKDGEDDDIDIKEIVKEEDMEEDDEMLMDEEEDELEEYEEVDPLDMEDNLQEYDDDKHPRKQDRNIEIEDEYEDEDVPKVDLDYIMYGSSDPADSEYELPDNELDEMRKRKLQEKDKDNLSDLKLDDEMDLDTNEDDGDEDDDEDLKLDIEDDEEEDDEDLKLDIEDDEEEDNEDEGEEEEEDEDDDKKVILVDGEGKEVKAESLQNAQILALAKIFYKKDFDSKKKKEIAEDINSAKSTKEVNKIYNKYISENVKDRSLESEQLFYAAKLFYEHELDKKEKSKILESIKSTRTVDDLIKVYDTIKKKLADSSKSRKHIGESSEKVSEKRIPLIEMKRQEASNMRRISNVFKSENQQKPISINELNYGIVDSSFVKRMVKLSKKST